MTDAERSSLPTSSAVQRFGRGVAHPMVWLGGICGGEAAFPLVVLFGLNAVDELDRAAFGVLLPDIQDSFGINIATMLSIVALSSVAALALQVPIAQYADRSKRVPLVIIGALTWGFFSGMTGLAIGLIMLTIARSGSALGKAVIDPTHNSLIADYYPVETRAKVFSVHRAANAVGAFIGPLSAGLLAYYFGWRVPFLVFVIPTVIFAGLAFRLHEPTRGRWERQAAGASQEVIDTEEETPSYAEGWRTVHKVASLRRIWWSLPFLAVALIGFLSLGSLFYDQEFGLGERGRGFAFAITEPFQVIGLIVGARIATRRLIAGDIRGLIRFYSTIALAAAAVLTLFALSPNIYIAIALNCLISASLAIIGPGLLTVLSLAIPPRARATGFSVGSLWVIPGLLVLPAIGWVADNWSIRIGMLVMLPMFIIGSLILRSVGDVIDADIAQVWQSAATRSGVLFDRRQGNSNLLLIRGVEAGYDGRPVLHGIDLHLDAGEVVALLGTNGAGKSTLLKAISGIVEADRGAIVLDGRDITHAPPNEIAALGIVQMPGGRGVFGSLTVQENLDLAGWTNRRDADGVRDAIRVALDTFAVLATRLDEPAANLSGGQQQMLALAMSFVMRPKVLLIDELSLGLAPVIVGQLLPIVRRMADDGVTVVLVEQSVNVALTVAERAYFMERGEIRFSGPTAELLERPDLLRSVFLADAGQPSPTNANLAHGGPDPEGARSAVLEVTGLSVSFGGIRAVDNVSFEIGASEIVGVIGPNGAGKTTVFDLISGFTPLTAGRIVLAGHDVTSMSSAGRASAGLGRSFQDARLFPELTVEETLAVSLERFVSSRSVLVAALHLPMAYESEAQIARRVDELVELMGLAPYRHSFVRELSTGTRRIVDLACLVAHRPAVILLDEPSSGIAQREVEALAPVVERLRNEIGASLVIVEHDIPFVSSVADRLIALDQGRVVTTGSPADVLGHPDVIESYLGTSSAAIARSGGTE